MTKTSSIATAAGCLLLASCGGAQSSLDPAGPQSGRILNLWWLLFWVSAAVWLLVTAFLVMAALRSKRQAAPVTEPILTRHVAIATGATVAILLVLLVASAATGAGLALSHFDDPLNIQVTGNEWWWQFQYENSRPDLTVITANELHIPVGRPVVLKVTSQDVIHSFWAPNLSGKIDTIPAHVNTVWLRADRAGIFRGQCAEFCGLQHAHMGFLVIAEPPDKFDAWMNNQRRPAREPSNPIEARGREVFLASPCVLCHTIRGIGANGQVAPDLTHLASRGTIAAGTLSNTPGNLAGWVTDAQRVKPGNNMPAINIGSDDLQALVAYLESLQ